LWSETLSILESELSRTSFQTWMKSTKLLSLRDGRVVIGVPNEFAKDWFVNRYYNLVKDTMELITDQKLSLSFVVPNEEASVFQQNTTPNLSRETDQSPQTAFSEDSLAAQLNPRYNFDSFVVGNSNRFAHAACLAVAENPGHAYNPLFIYGDVGLGKTHLMHGIGHYVLMNSPREQVVYVTSERFTNELINAIRDHTTEQFREKYRTIDVLLIDDIQFLAGKEQTQEEFFHTFNTLYEANKQIIISSDRPPKDIPTLEHRLRSRFEWGLITDIQSPDFETRVAILKKKANYENIVLHDEIFTYLATRVQSNIRELEGALIKVGAYQSFNQEQITVQKAAEIIKDFAAGQQVNKVSIENIQQVVAKYFNLEQKDLKAKNRSRNVAYPRQIAMYLTRDLTDSSLPKIGEAFGGRDHTTVIHACEKISSSLKDDPTLANIINEIKNILSV